MRRGNAQGEGDRQERKENYKDISPCSNFGKESSIMKEVFHASIVLSLSLICPAQNDFPSILVPKHFLSPPPISAF